MGDRQYQTECEFLSDILKTNGVEQNVILGEDKASFTQQNARYSKKLLEDKKIEIKKAIISGIKIISAFCNVSCTNTKLEISCMILLFIFSSFS